MNRESTLDLAREIKSELKRIIKFDQLILIGHFNVDVSSNKELDFAVVVDDKVSKFEFVNATSDFAVKYISSYKLMFQFFPINRMHFQLKTTSFLRSISSNGIEI